MLSFYCFLLEKVLLDGFYRNYQQICLQIVLGTQLTDCISSSRLYSKCSSILLSRTIIRKKLRWLEYNVLSEVFFFCVFVLCSAVSSGSQINYYYILRLEADRLFFLANFLRLNEKQFILC